MGIRNGRYQRLRYTSAGALATLAVVGGIAGTEALAARQHPGMRHHAAQATTNTIKSPGQPGQPAPTKVRAPSPGSDQPFLAAAQQLVSSGAITAAEGQTLESEITAGTVDTDTLTAAGFTQAQLQAVQQALTSTKEALAPDAGGPNGSK